MGFSAIGDTTLQEKYNWIRFVQMNLVDRMPNLLSFFMRLPENVIICIWQISASLLLYFCHHAYYLTPLIV